MDEQQQTTPKPTSQAARLHDLTRSVQGLEARVSGVGDTVSELNAQAVQFISERPVAAIGIAFGVGYLVGKLANRRWLT